MQVKNECINLHLSVSLCLIWYPSLCVVYESALLAHTLHVVRYCVGVSSISLASTCSEILLKACWKFSLEYTDCLCEGVWLFNNFPLSFVTLTQLIVAARLLFTTSDRLLFIHLSYMCLVIRYKYNGLCSLIGLIYWVFLLPSSCRSDSLSRADSEEPIVLGIWITPKN